MVRNWLPKSWRRFLSSKQPSRKASRSAPYRPYLEVLEDRLVLSNIFTVTNTSDSGTGSLRAAITSANAASGPSTIDFAITGSGAQTINLLSALPIITNAVTIDGSTQTNFAGTPLIVLNGSGAGSGANGLTITAGNSTVKDLAIDNFSGDGIELVTGGDDVLTGNYIGVDSTGKTAAPNGSGVYIYSANNTVGGTTAAALNVISGNNFGVAIVGSGASGNAVEGNYIGTDNTGAAKLSNTYGVIVAEGAANNTVGGTAAADLNVISGNSYAGMQIQDSGSTGNVVEGNYIGTDKTGLVALGNGYGVSIYGSASNTVGAGNVLSGNGFGVAISSSGASGNVVEGNYIGADKSGAKALGNAYGVYIENGAANNVVGGTTTAALNVLSGNSFGAVISGSGTSGNVLEGNYIGTDLTGTKAVANTYGIVVYSSATNNIIGGTVTAALNVISGNTQQGAFIDGTGTTGNVVEGNYIGTDLTGAKALANTYGVFVSDGAASNTVGGTTAGALNVISGNSYTGVQLASSGTSGNVMEGNYIGTDKTGLVGLGNGGFGVAIIFGASGNVVGGTTTAALNVISANTYYGVEIIGTGATGNVVEGNYVGTDKTGTAKLANSYGVYIAGGSASNTVGGTVSGAANVLSGNTFGVVVSDSGTTGNVVEGNYIGTDLTGTKAVGNTYGVYVYSSAANNIIGGTTAGARNIISANSGGGVFLTGSGSTGNAVEGNYIGTDITGSVALGNGDGVVIGSASNTVGGTVSGAANVIANSTYYGVSVNTGAGNAIRENTIYNSGNLGILLYNGGNNNQAAPTLTSATTNGTSITITGTLTATPSTAYALDFFASPTANPSGGEGKIYLGSATVTTNASGTASFTKTFNVPVPGGYAISATATDPNGNTSQFATDVTATSNLFVVTNTNDSGAGSLRAAITAANAATGTGFIDFDIPGSGAQTISLLSALPTITNSVIINGASQPGFAGTPLIVLDGTSAGSGANGLTITAGNSTVEDLVIDHFKGDGIDLQTGGGNVLIGNYLGVDSTGAAAAANGFGVYIEKGSANNTVGGTTTAARNVISANSSYAVGINGGGVSGNVVEGNYIGTNAAGTAAMQTPSNFTYGVVVDVTATNNTIGGTVSGARNVISGYYADVQIQGASAANVVEGNYLGTDYTGTVALASSYGVAFYAGSANNTVGGTTTGARNVIAGANTGIYFSAIGTSNNVVEGNYIGTDVTGTAKLGNVYGVVATAGAGGNVIGGTTVAARNVISANTTYGVEIGATGVAGPTGNVVEGNYIGTDAAGDNAITTLGNGTGVAILAGASSNTVGGTVSGAGNVIAYNSNNGVQVDNSASAGNAIRQNSIHDNDQSNNSSLGIALTNGGNNSQVAPTLTSAATDGKIISIQGTLTAPTSTKTTYTLDFFANPTLDNASNAEGQLYLGSATVTTTSTNPTNFTTPAFNVPVPAGYYISATATDPSGNTSQFSTGVAATAPANLFTVTTTSDSGAGSLRAAITSADAATGPSFIDFSIGSGVQTISLLSALPTITNPTIIEGASQPGFSGAPLIVLNGSGAGSGANGLTISAGSSFVGDLVIDNFSGSGIELDTGGGNALVGNYLGVASDGATAAADGFGVAILNSSANNTVGGTTAAARNVISANSSYAMKILGTGVSGNVVEGNYIGTNAAGTAAAQNRNSFTYGLVVDGGATNNTIGGTVSGARNVISGYYTGVQIQGASASNVVEGNYVGTDYTGTVALANSYGVAFYGGATNNTVGGTTTAARNVISGNAADGLHFSNTGTTGNVVQGNYIGTDVTGTKALGNANGVYFTDGAGNNTVGGTTTAALNVISANTSYGVEVTGSVSGNAVQGNYIGTDAAGDNAITTLGNGTGVAILAGATSNTVGGTVSGASNVIAYNSNDGVQVDGSTSTGNAIRQNSIHDNDQSNNSSLGIALTNSGNNSQVAPTLTLAATDGHIISIQGTLTATASTTYALDFFASPTVDKASNAEGQQYLGSASVTTNASGTVSFTESFSVAVPVGYVISATATDPNGNTSQFATGEAATTPANLFTVTNTGNSGTGSLQAAITSANAATGLSFIDFNISGSGAQTINLSSALPTISKAVVIDGASQPGFSGTPLIVLNGSGITASGTNGLTIASSNSFVQDLAIDSFTGAGIDLQTGSGNVIAGNYLGVASNGTTGAANGNGVVIEVGSANNTIGGTTATARNVISANTTDGVDIASTGGSGNVVEGNYIGTDYTGNVKVGNGKGVVIDSASNTVGGTASGAGNVISASTNNGVELDAGTNLVEGNLIGANWTGTANMGNLGNGVAINSANNTIGGTATGAANVIIYSNADGVNVTGGSSTGNVIRGNSIHDNDRATSGNFGINLVSGGNNSQAAPTLSSAVSNGTSITINGTITAPTSASTTYTIDFYANSGTDHGHNAEGQLYLGSVTVTTTSTSATSFPQAIFNVSGLANYYITATATDPNGNTSPFSAYVQAT